MASSLFDYQSERHCSKTLDIVEPPVFVFDYQSERHCSKTVCVDYERGNSLITSQNDTAPKPAAVVALLGVSLITSQNDTAPNLLVGDVLVAVV